MRASMGACRLHRHPMVSLALLAPSSVEGLPVQQGGSRGLGGAMRRTAVFAAVAYIAAVALLLISRPASSQNALDGKSIFRFDTFGDEQLWTNTLHLEQPVARLSPAGALGVGLRVDVDALRTTVANQLKANLVNLNDPP